MEKKYIIVGIAVLVVIFGVWAYRASWGPGPEPSSGDNTGVPANDTEPQSGTQGPAPSGGGSPQGSTPPISGDKGRVVFGITDAAVSLDTIKSVMLTVDRVRAEHEESGWIEVTKTPRVFDLLELKRGGITALLGDVELPKGNYIQVRLDVGSVAVIKNDGSVSLAKLPSGEIRVPLRFVAKRGEPSVIVFDFQLDRSLHTAVDGKYILAPVIKVSSRGNALVTIVPPNKIQASSGASALQLSVGMNESGELKEGFTLNPLSKFELLGSVIKVIPQTETEAGVTIGAQKAIDIAIQSGAFSAARSVVLMNISGAKAWRVTGLRGSALTSVNIHAETGAILK